MKGLTAVFSVIFSLAFVAWMGARVVNSIVFDRNCEGYLKRAADANTIELAKQNLGVAVKYLENNQLTSGYTSVVYRTPDEDVGFWYENLRASLKELNEVRPDATQLEKSNVLMKLRETLLDEGENGTCVTVPNGMSVFPNNVAYANWGIVSLLLAGLFGLVALASDD